MILTDAKGKPIKCGQEVIFIPTEHVLFAKVKDIRDLIVATGPNQGRSVVLEFEMRLPAGPVAIGNVVITDQPKELS